MEEMEAGIKKSEESFKMVPQAEKTKQVKILLGLFVLQHPSLRRICRRQALARGSRERLDQGTDVSLNAERQGHHALTPQKTPYFPSKTPQKTPFFEAIVGVSTHLCPQNVGFCLAV